MLTSFLRFIYIIYIIAKYNLLELIINGNTITYKILLYTLNPIFKKTYLQGKGKRFRLALEELGPIFTKFGQLLSIRIDVLPSDISKELKKLQTNTYTSNVKDIKQIIETNLNLNIKNIFKKFNENPIASASVAQIHTGLLKTNQKVAIKIIKPNIKDTIKKDMALLNIISKLITVFFKKFKRLKPIEIILELNEILKNELNLKKEAANSVKLKQNFEKICHIYIPKIYWEYSTENMLVSEFIEGINITNIKKLKKNNINIEKLSYKLVEFFYLQALKYRFFHADLHPGNILILNTNTPINKITLLDFGIVSSIKKSEKNYLTENILAFSQRNYRKVAYLHIKSKTMITEKSIDDLEKEICYICEPILNKPIKNISFEKTLTALINLTRAFNMQIQPKLILFQKTLMTIEGISRQINPNINLWKITRQSLEKIIFSDTIRKNTPIKIINKIIQSTKINKTKTLHEKSLDKIKPNKKLILILGYIIGNITVITFLNIL
ncbi:MAG TPA: AarF/UbiB family protein [Candidatus Azoamicus sp. OHIO1]